MEKKLLIQDMTDAIAAKGGITPKEALAFVTALFEVIEQALIDDKFIKIKGLGTFKIVNVNERESVDVNTGERIFISGHARVSFTPDSQLKELVNRPFAHFETVIINDDACLEEFENVEEEPDPEDPDWEEDDHDDEEIPEAEDTEESLNPHDAIEEAKAEREADLGELCIPVYDAATLVDREPVLTKDEEDEAQTHKQTTAMPEKDATEETQIVTDENTETLRASDAALAAHKQPAVSDNELVGPIDEPETEAPKQAETVVEADRATEAKAEAATGATLPTDSKMDREAEKEFPSHKKAQTGDPKTSSTCCDSDGQHHIEYVLKEKRLPFYNIWKIVSVLLFALLLLLLTYFAGYFRWFCPCETTVYDNPYLQGMTATQDCILPAADSATTAVDSMTRDTAVLVPEVNVKPELAAVDEAASSAKVTKADKSSSVEPKTAEGKKTEAARKTTAPTPTSNTTAGTKTKVRTPEKAIKPAPAPQYDQVEGGKFEIVGTMRNYRVKRGESIRSIALKVYGSKGYAVYIATHNQLKDPNLISADTLLKLPELKRRDNK